MSTGSTAEDAPTTVLVTGAGGTGGMATIQSLQRTTEFEVLGADMDPDAVGLFVADEGLVVPAGTENSWVDRIATHVVEYDVDAIIPLVDEELRQLNRLRDTVHGTAVVAPDVAVVERCLDKYRLMTDLDEAGFAVPDTWTVAETREVHREAYPLLVKPRRGRGSRGVRRLSSPTELDEYLMETEIEPADLLVQSYVEGTEYTTSVVCTTDNSIEAVVPKVAVQKNGSTTHGFTKATPEVADSCRRICRFLEPGGPINVQQIRDENGNVYTIEINPRFSSSACLTVAAGVDELGILVRDAIDEPYETATDFEDDFHMLRYLDQIFVSGDDVEGTRNQSEQ